MEMNILFDTEQSFWTRCSLVIKSGFITRIQNLNLNEIYMGKVLLYNWWDSKNIHHYEILQNEPKIDLGREGVCVM